MIVLKMWLKKQMKMQVRVKMNLLLMQKSLLLKQTLHWMVVEMIGFGCLKQNWHVPNWKIRRCTGHSRVECCMLRQST